MTDNVLSILDTKRITDPNTGKRVTVRIATLNQRTRVYVVGKGLVVGKPAPEDLKRYKEFDEAYGVYNRFRIEEVWGTRAVIYE